MSNEILTPEDENKIDNEINNPPVKPDPISAIPSNTLLGKIRDFINLIFGGFKKQF